MIGLRDFCAALLGVAVGGAGVVAVQQAKPAKPRAAKATSHAPAPAPQVQRFARPSGGDIVIFEGVHVAPFCPPSILMVPSFPPEAALSHGAPPTGGGGSGFLPPPFSSAPGAIPEPATWAMLIAGFGMVGASLRHKVVQA